ncbi:hypothetical protein [Saccharothrix coeruleofusca]|uniref:Uncharacterized protein n=1 Tax=Saccharothrix coeruleofusca TaxID=33919 RepID=A0A918AFX5_9PSEU|nr:hypothetical protein [Saccharothrix coeruleofusca]MBP2340572.1 hypothetical protein [Saccharothrix coeruleofusca]GGP34543.1 hypothetical protein GCM10010185_01480 [Saccharothrix coeruleofusca]
MGLVAAPLTALTSVVLYFGWNRQTAIYGYFGLDQAALKFSVQDYLLRGVGVVFRPLAFLLCGLVLLLLVNRWAARFTPPGPLVPALRAVLALGLAVCAGAALAGRFEPLLGALALAAAAVLGGPLLHRDRRAFACRAVVGAVVAFAVFWATTVHATRSGLALAAHVDRHPASRPALVVHSAAKLDLPAPLVAETRLVDPDGKVSYRYTGLRLFAYAGDRWVVIVGREPGRRKLTITTLRDNDSIRVDVVNG